MAPKKPYAGRDLFPSNGPVLEYKPYILSESLKYSQKYYLQHREVVAQAVIIAHAAEKKYDPKRGKFGTLLYWELLQLHRWCQDRYRFKHHQHQTVSKPEDYKLEDRKKARKKASEDLRALKISWQPRHDELDLDMSGEGKLRNYARWKEACGRDKWQVMAEAAAGERPYMKNEKQRAVLDWMVGDLLGQETRTMMQAAADIGITRGYASKVVCRVARDTLWQLH